MRVLITVKTNANDNSIEKIDDRYYKVCLKERPVEGKANLLLIKLLSKYFNGRARIVSGFNSKKKMVEIL